MSQKVPEGAQELRRAVPAHTVSVPTTTGSHPEPPAPSQSLVWVHSCTPQLHHKWQFKRVNQGGNNSSVIFSNRIISLVLLTTLTQGQCCRPWNRTFWVQLDKMDQAIEPLLFLTPRHTCFILCSSSDSQPLGEIYHQATYIPTCH